MTTEATTDLDLARAPFTWNTLNYISKTEFVPAGLRGKPHAILAAVLTGRELGLGPMESLRSIDIIDGRPSPSAEWMVGRILGAGHVVTTLEQTDKTCTVKGTRYDLVPMPSDEVKKVEIASMQFTFTIEMAERAGLAKKRNWQQYPEAMLYWRAVAQLARQFFPDCLRGIKYLADELGDEDWMEPPMTTSEEPDVIDVDDIEEVVEMALEMEEA
jgi:hypothetical protein